MPQQFRRNISSGTRETKRNAFPSSDDFENCSRSLYRTFEASRCRFSEDAGRFAGVRFRAPFAYSGSVFVVVFPSVRSCAPSMQRGTFEDRINRVSVFLRTTECPRSIVSEVQRGGNTVGHSNSHKWLGIFATKIRCPLERPARNARLVRFSSCQQLQHPRAKLDDRN